MDTQATKTPEVNEGGAPFFCINHVKGRVKVPAARLTFYGLELPDPTGETNHYSGGTEGRARAEFRIDDKDGATVNGTPVCCRYSLVLGETWTAEKDANGDNVRAVRWHVRDGSTSRTDVQFHPDAPDGARAALRALAETMATEYGTPDVIRQAVAAQLHREAERADGKAKEKADEAREARRIADRAASIAATFQAGGALFVSKYGTNAQPVRFYSTSRKECEEDAAAMWVHEYDRRDGNLPRAAEIVPAAR